MNKRETLGEGDLAKGCAEWDKIKREIQNAAEAMRRYPRSDGRGKRASRYESWRVPQPPSEELKALLYEQGYRKGPAMEEYWRERESQRTEEST